MRTMAVHLEFKDDAIGRRGGMVGLVGIVERKLVGHGVSPSVVAAPIAA
jgi:hypothetical protein